MDGFLKWKIAAEKKIELRHQSEMALVADWNLHFLPAHSEVTTQRRFANSGPWSMLYSSNIWQHISKPFFEQVKYFSEMHQVTF